MFLMFQAVFAWSRGAGRLDRSGDRCALGQAIGNALPDGWLRSLIVDGVFGGVGAVVVFLPQILILFLFILLLEATGYMVRAAFLMDRLMSRAGLSGRAFIPLAVELRLRRAGDHGDAHHRGSQGPADDHPGRAADDLLGAAAGLHADHRRLHPGRTVGPGIGLQGLVLFGLYIAGIVGALLAALVLRRTVVKGGGGALHDGDAQISAAAPHATSRSACGSAR